MTICDGNATQLILSKDMDQLLNDEHFITYNKRLLKNAINFNLVSKNIDHFKI